MAGAFIGIHPKQTFTYAIGKPDLQLKHAYVYFDDDSAATLLTRDEARWSATNVAKLTLMAANAMSN